MAKQEKYVTKSMLMEAVDTILNGMQKMFDEQNERLSNEITINRTKIQENKASIDDLKYDTPTRNEHEELKSRVQKLESN